MKDIRHPAVVVSAAANIRKGTGWLIATAALIFLAGPAGVWAQRAPSVTWSTGVATSYLSYLGFTLDEQPAWFSSAVASWKSCHLGAWMTVGLEAGSLGKDFGEELDLFAGCRRTAWGDRLELSAGVQYFFLNDLTDLSNDRWVVDAEIRWRPTTRLSPWLSVRRFERVGSSSAREGLFIRSGLQHSVKLRSTPDGRSTAWLTGLTLAWSLDGTNSRRDGHVYSRVRARKDGERLVLTARGISAHSMEPEQGVNAITHLADFLKLHEWPDSQAGRMVRLVNDLVGVGDYGERFGDLAHSHPFMGRLTLTLATVRREGDDLVAGLSFRRPVGRSREQMERSIATATDQWKAKTGIMELRVEVEVTDPYYLQDAPHVPVLLGVFRHFTHRPDARPISIGGATNARLVPFGVNFGPSMPGETYTGHSEHEFIRRDQLLLNLKMYAAALFELAALPPRGNL